MKKNLIMFNLKTHDMLHTESIHQISVVIIDRVAIASIVVIVHQTIANHDVVRTDHLVLLLQLQQSQLQTLIVLRVSLLREHTTLLLVSSTGSVVTVEESLVASAIYEHTI